MTAPTTRAGEYLVPSRARPTVCRSCGASIVWTKTMRGHAVPLDLATVEHRGGAMWALTHFAVCPHSREWRYPAIADNRKTDSRESVGCDVSSIGYRISAMSEDPRWTAWREKARLADGTLPLAWWSAFRADLRSAPAAAHDDVDREAVLAVELE